MKIGISSYSYNQLMSSGEMTLEDIIKQTAEFGFDAIEFSGLHYCPEGETPASYAPTVKSLCADAGLPIASYTIGADFLRGSDGDLAKEIDRVKAEVDIAVALGVPCMRHDATRGFPEGTQVAQSFADCLPRVSEGIRAVTEYAKTGGVKTTVENHGFFCQDADRVESLICAVDHENFGVLFDVGNFLCADEDPTIAAGKLAPYVFHLHAKDFHVISGSSFAPGEGWFKSRAGNYLRGAIIGHGNVPIKQAIQVIKDSGYDGICSIEFEGIECPLKGIRIGRDNLQRIIESLD